jgi:uncharacterized protein
MSGRVLIDTSAYYAFMDTGATEHTLARRAFLRLINDGTELSTTTFVVAEIHAMLVIRTNRHFAASALDRLYGSSIRIIRPTEGDETHARAIIHHYQDKEFSFADAVSFAVMERLHIRRAWSYDHHFGQYGWALEQ